LGWRDFGTLIELELPVLLALQTRLETINPSTDLDNRENITFDVNDKKYKVDSETVVPFGHITTNPRKDDNNWWVYQVDNPTESKGKRDEGVAGAPEHFKFEQFKTAVKNAIVKRRANDKENKCKTEYDSCLEK